MTFLSCLDHCFSIIITWPFTVTLRVKYCPNFKGLEDSFPDGSAGKESTRNAGDPGSIPGLGRSPGEQNGYPLQYSGLENSKDRGAWQATIRGVAISVRNDAAISNFCHPADAATPYSDGWGAGGTQEAAICHSFK